MDSISFVSSISTIVSEIPVYNSLQIITIFEILVFFLFLFLVLLGKKNPTIVSEFRNITIVEILFKIFFSFFRSIVRRLKSSRKDLFLWFLHVILLCNGEVKERKRNPAIVSEIPIYNFRNSRVPFFFDHFLKRNVELNSTRKKNCFRNITIVGILAFSLSRSIFKARMDPSPWFPRLLHFSELKKKKKK